MRESLQNYSFVTLTPGDASSVGLVGDKAAKESGGRF